MRVDMKNDKLYAFTSKQVATAKIGGKDKGYSVRMEPSADGAGVKVIVSDASGRVVTTNLEMGKSSAPFEKLFVWRMMPPNVA